MLAGAVGVLMLLTAIFAAQTAALRVESRARLALDAGIRSAAAGEFAAAAAQFAMAHDRASTGSGQALRSLADLALRHKNEAVAAGQIRDRAEEFFRKVDPIRFRLITGRGLKAASQDLEATFAEFKIFGPTLWTRDPELDRLDPARRGRLLEEVNEVLYLWVIASDLPGDANQARRAAAVCERALRSPSRRRPGKHSKPGTTGPGRAGISRGPARGPTPALVAAFNGACSPCSRAGPNTPWPGSSGLSARGPISFGTSLLSLTIKRSTVMRGRPWLTMTQRSRCGLNRPGRN